MEGHIAVMEDMRNTHKFSVGKPEGKSLLERYGCRSEDNSVKIDFNEMAYEDVDWIRRAEDGV
jgi:hypothetical protein